MSCGGCFEFLTSLGFVEGKPQLAHRGADTGTTGSDDEHSKVQQSSQDKSQNSDASWSNLRDDMHGGGEVRTVTNTVRDIVETSCIPPCDSIDTATRSKPVRPVPLDLPSNVQSTTETTSPSKASKPMRVLRSLACESAKGARRSAGAMRKAVFCSGQRSFSGTLSGTFCNSPKLRRPAAFGETNVETVLGEQPDDGKPVDGDIVRQPEDGSCLFHSIAFGLGDGTNGDDLRRQVAETIEDEPSLKIANTSVGEWVAMSMGKSSQAHGQELFRGEVWGGALELALAAKLRRVNIHVYEKCQGGYRCISAFNEPTAKQTVNVAYRRDPIRHYDALKLGRPTT